MTGNLPSWPGASVVYSRVYRINETLCELAYLQHLTTRRRKSDRYTVPAEVRASIEALDRGDEEALKAYVAAHLALAMQVEMVAQ